MVIFFVFSRYLVTSGLVDRIKRHGSALVESDFLVDQDKDSPLLVACYDLLTRFCIQLKAAKTTHTNQHPQESSGDSNPQPDSPHHPNNNSSSSAESHLLSLLSQTEAAGAVGALYASLALTTKVPAAGLPLQGGPTNSAKNLAYAGLRLLKNVAELDLDKLQVFI